MMEKIPAILSGSDNLKLKLGKKSFGCFILDNSQRVITFESIPKAFGYDGKSENWIFEFLMGINRLTPVEPALLEALGRPVRFHLSNAEAIRLGIPAGILVEACQTIIEAKKNGFLYISELPFAKAAEDIVSQLNVNIEQIIDFSTGYTLFKQNHKESIARQMHKMGGKNYPFWIRAFTDDFLETIFSFRGWNWEDLNENPKVVGNYINELIFNRLENNLFAFLENSKPKMKYSKVNTPEQYLEHPELTDYNSAIIALLKASGMNSSIFDQLLNKSFPKQRELQLETLTTTAKTSAVKHAFNESLQKAVSPKK